jgi:hypothetical protein
MALLHICSYYLNRGLKPMSISKDYVSLKILEGQIRIARNRMQRLWGEKGYTDDEVLAASIEVDRLLNEYDRVTGLLMQERK